MLASVEHHERREKGTVVRDGVGRVRRPHGRCTHPGVPAYIVCIDMRPAFQEAVSAIERDDAASLAALIRAGLDVNTTHSEPEGFNYSPDEIPSLLH